MFLLSLLASSSSGLMSSIVSMSVHTVQSYLVSYRNTRTCTGVRFVSIRSINFFLFSGSSSLSLIWSNRSCVTFLWSSSLLLVVAGSSSSDDFSTSILLHYFSSWSTRSCFMDSSNFLSSVSVSGGMALLCLWGWVPFSHLLFPIFVESSMGNTWSGLWNVTPDQDCGK